MLCQNCGKNEANVKYTQIINGVKKQMNLCEDCARDLGIDNISFNMPRIDFSNFIGGMFEDEIKEFIPSLIKPETLLCGKCGLSYEDFIQSGKFGCSECYNTFESQIDALLRNIHGANRHVGRKGKMIIADNKKEKVKENKEKIKENDKVEETKNIDKQIENTKTNKEDEIQKLQDRLKKEIEEERYEDAAKTRDEINNLKK